LATLASITKIDYRNIVQPISIEVRNFLAHYCSIEGEIDGNHGIIISNNIYNIGNIS
jgi:hypothetical protein